MNHPSVSPRARRWAAAAALLLVCVAGGAAVLAFRQELWAILTSQAAGTSSSAGCRARESGAFWSFWPCRFCQVVVAVLPGEPVELMAGALFGPVGGLLICLAGILLGSMFIYAAMKLLGAKAVPAQAFHKYRFLQDEQRARAGAVSAVFPARHPQGYAHLYWPVSAGETGGILLHLHAGPHSQRGHQHLAGSSLADGGLLVPIVIFVVMGALGLACLYGEQRILDRLHQRRES